MKYTFSIENSNSHLLSIQLVIDKVESDQLTVQLPSWRPGRYELANFAKNIQKLKVYGKEMQELTFAKLSKDSWKIETGETDEVYIEYNYYASELNAGSTWLDNKQMYVNPVNCCLFVPDRMDELCEIEVDVPYPYEVATGMNKTGNLTFTVVDFHELADSPFIASPTLQHEEYEVDDVKFHIWFQGEIRPNWAKIQLDFEQFTSKQIVAFGDFPVKEYHFLFQITPYRSYHGVEHKTSTVCLIGPGYDVMGKRYIDFLGVSSHELYHVWNVKTIRPREMLPYDYTRENYSRLGYVYEGVTTYMGDKFLFSSTVIDEEQYFKELQTYMERHIHNGGRFNLSVADSSYDTWLDGYQSGVPDRKTSIYAEGCLFSFILDVALISSPNSTGGLDDVLRRMYVELASKDVGYSQEDYIRISSEVAGRDISELFESLVETPVDYGEALMNAFEQIGLEFSIVDDRSWVRKFGLKGTYSNGKYKVADVAFESDAYNSNVIRGDQIVSVNGYTIDESLDNWLAYFGKEKQELGVVRDGKYRGIIADPEFTNGFQKCKIKHIENVTESQKQNFEKWLNK